MTGVSPSGNPRSIGGEVEAASFFFFFNFNNSRVLHSNRQDVLCVWVNATVRISNCVWDTMDVCGAAANALLMTRGRGLYFHRRERERERNVVFCLGQMGGPE